MANSSTPLSKPHFQNLDALRFFAFLCVFLSHCPDMLNYTFASKPAELIHRHLFGNGDLGVNFFFVLSGFLITWLLLLEKSGRGQIHVGAFYMRRVLRIWPVYFLVVAVGFILGTQGHIPLLDRVAFPYAVDGGQLTWFLLFLANYDIILHGISSAILMVLWSVSVEEQFYLVWPLLVLLLSRKSLPYLCWAVILVSFVCRFFPYPHSIYSTLWAMPYLSAGGLAAWYGRNRPGFTGFFKTLSRRRILLAYFFFFLLVAFRGFSHIFGASAYWLYFPFEGLLFSGFFIFIILEQVFADHSFFKSGRIPLLNRLGRMSYGLYAYHMISFPLVYLAEENLGLQGSGPAWYLVKLITAFLLTFTLSAISYYCYEKKILSLKKYFQPGEAGLTELNIIK